MPILTLTGEVAQGLAAAVRTSFIETPVVTPEVVLALPIEVREKIFFAIVEELIRENGNQSLIPMTHSDGRSFGYIVPPEAAKRRHERMMAELPEAVRNELNKPLPADFDLNQTFDMNEFLDELSRQDEIGISAVTCSL